MARGRTGRPETKSATWPAMKAAAIARDDGICWICGGSGADSADHVVPLADGGRHHVDNLRAAHHNTGPRCNRVKGERSVEFARAKLAGRSAPPRRLTPRWSRDWRGAEGGVDYSDPRNW